MNATTPFSLVAEQPSSMLTRLDCSDPENVKDARHQLRACRTEADYARWAATWGENLCHRAEDMVGLDEGFFTPDEHAEVTEKLTALLDEVEDALKALETFADEHLGTKAGQAAAGAIHAKLKAAAEAAEVEEQ